jgi:hypothetical protein
VSAGEEVGFTVNIRNTGRRPLSSEDSQPVRLLVRWHDAATGRRSRWEIKWLRAVVVPGGSTQMSIDVTAPPRPGRFTLHLALVRLSTGRYEAPPIDARRDENEFSSIAYRVTVR